MNSQRDNFKILTFVSQFAINMLVPIFLCSFAGYYIDEYFGTSIWFVALFFVGAIAGGRNIFILAKKSYSGVSDFEKTHYGSAFKDVSDNKDGYTSEENDKEEDSDL